MSILDLFRRQRKELEASTFEDVEEETIDFHEQEAEKNEDNEKSS